MADRYVGRHRKARPHRHQRLIDHVEACTPCVKLRVAAALYVLLFACLAIAAFGGVTVVPQDTQQVAFVSAGPAYSPAVETACWR